MITDTGKTYNTGYYMYPRSSLSKTQLRLANSTGIIDAGYRGNLIAAFRNLYADSYTVEKYTRLVQICHPTLCPIFVIFIKNDSDLSNTARGNGGFGSTG
jgi:dUTP pyrophosphatase